MAIEILTNIITRLREGRFPNEQAISQGIVLPLLQELGWDIWDTNVVWPEFQTGEGRVDFALCHPQSKPAVFIEVKQPGGAEGGVRQALEYAFHTGVPFIVLTDGRTWSFYLPAEQGSYEDRRVYMLDLFEREAVQAVETLKKYLSITRVKSGKALDSARKEYRSRNRHLAARNAIPASWKELLEKGDELLIELIADTVESKVGVRPEEDDIIAFLLGQLNKPAMITTPTTRPRPVSSEERSMRHGTLVIKGETLRYVNAKEAMVIILRELARADPSFLQRCSQRSEFNGRKRRYIAQSVDDLYPDRPDLRRCNEQLPGGWYVATNLNNQLKKSIIKAASEVAGLTYGSNISVEF